MVKANPPETNPIITEGIDSDILNASSIKE
jgi:hypothetical protein